MPWTGLSKQYSAGPFVFQPWDSFVDGDEDQRSHLARYFSQHVDHQGNRVSSIMIVRREDQSPFTQLVGAVEAVNAFQFSAIAPDVAAAVAGGRSITPPTADRFELVQQRFRLGDDEVAVQVGLSTHLARLDAITLPKPWDLGGPCLPDGELLTALGGLFDPAVPADFRNRIFRSLEWFRIAHVGGESVSNLSRLVMMSTAFEIMLEFPRNGKRRHFVEKVDSLLKTDKTRQTLVNDSRGNPQNVSAPAEWASSFYRLRSEIVHGDEVAPEQLRYLDWISHLIVADIVFFQCVRFELYEYGLLGASTRAAIAQSGRNAMTELLEHQLLGFDSHEALGWID